MVDAERFVEPVIDGIGQGDDFVVRADAVAAGEAGLSGDEFDIAPVALDADDGVGASELVSL